MASLLHFLLRVLRKFSDNKGLLLASAVAYNVLLSAIPIAAVLAVALSQLMDGDQAVDIVARQIGWVAPTQATAIARDLSGFVEHREVIGGIGVLVMFFFSALAFRMLDQAFEAIFGPHQPSSRRGYWLRVALPYVLVVVLCMGVVISTLVTSWIESLAGSTISVVGRDFDLPDLHGLIWFGVGFSVQAAVFTLLYSIMPAARVSAGRAAIGGACAAMLWELTRRFLVWYFANVSLVSVIYGSFATVVVILLMMEAGAIIVLLGAQVIAELEPATAVAHPQGDRAPRSPAADSTEAVGAGAEAPQGSTATTAAASESASRRSLQQLTSTSS